MTARLGTAILATLTIAAATPTQAPQAPAVCRESEAVCMRDTSVGHALMEEPGWAIQTLWVAFGNAGDSVEMGILHDGTQTPRRVKTVRLLRDGAIIAVVDHDDVGSDTVAYWLHLRRVQAGKSNNLKPSGRTATLKLSARRATDRLALVPLGAAQRAFDWSDWRVFGTEYKVALVTDSLYLVCKLPCATRDTVKLTPGARVTKRY